jgi:hypothetical protein
LHWVAFFFVASMSVVVLQALLGDPSESLANRLKAEAGEFIFMGVVLLCLFPAFILDTIRFSNRFVGPIARLRRFLRELGRDKKFNRLAFRDNDFWADIAEEYNRVVELMRNQEEEISRLKEQTNQPAN